MTEETKVRPAPKEEKHRKYAVIQVRGTLKTPHQVPEALLFMNLTRKNHCTVLEDNPVNKGMIFKVKDFVTWGEIDEETLKLIIEKRGEEYTGRATDSKKKYPAYPFFEYEGKKYKPYFRLSPPQKGFGRKGIKVSFPAGGALGYRGEKINDLIRRML